MAKPGDVKATEIDTGGAGRVGPPTGSMQQAPIVQDGGHGVHSSIAKVQEIVDSLQRCKHPRARGEQLLGGLLELEYGCTSICRQVVSSAVQEHDHVEVAIWWLARVHRVYSVTGRSQTHSHRESCTDLRYPIHRPSLQSRKERKERLAATYVQTGQERTQGVSGSYAMHR